MTVTRRPRLVPTGDCFCGCGGQAGIGRWFVRGHDITAAAALRALEGRSLAEQLVAAGYGPDRSVVDEAVAKAGWQRCPRCSYAGSPAALAAHGRECAGAAPAEEPPAAAGRQPSAPPAPVEPAGTGASEQVEDPEPVGDAQPAGRALPQEAGLEVERGTSGAAWDLLVPGRLDPVWKTIPQAERSELAAAAGRLLQPLKSPLDRPEARQTLYALKAAQRDRLVGVHWRRLLTAPRQALGAGRNARADELYQLLEVLAARHLAPATPADGSVLGAGPAPA
ncbi:hypothetical protein [Streptacidiphilus sp. EB103A]|uniref:hypothetical protein n=1 Tax=Streptacidiphilus sp. EB103A TaxID=3156275 RepID=UPI0035126A3B